jgi:large conductance mechanosensitive channel
MALTDCPECGKSISALADECTNCGYPLADEKAKSAAKPKGIAGFVDFVRKTGVVGIAIAFIIGAAVGVVVAALISDLINPIIGAIFHTSNLDSLTFTVGSATFTYGHFIGIVINFIIILAVVYLIFKVLGLERLDKAK